ncbi:MAG: hypothetical protein IKZ65_00405 [Lachnospiraceae bacterium]|nr:hypothetical protein [Lachnospiraceae bacterium]
MDNLFFSKTLQEKLKKVNTSSLSVLEAPAGYGKTTAVNMLLDGSNSQVNWYTAVESMPDSSFRWFISQISNVDETAARRLQDLGYLNRSNAVFAAAIIAEIKPSEPLTLVFDNFQFALANWQPQVLDALAKLPQSDLKTIFISQNFGRMRDILNALESSICYIKSGDLMLTERDIEEFARQMKIDITPQEAKKIREKTDGWTAAVSLYLENKKEGAENEDAEGLDELLDVSFWHSLMEPQKEILLRVCLFDHITPRILEMLVPEALLTQEEQVQLLRRTPLVLYRENKKALYPHELLTTFLRHQLAKTDEKFQSEVLRKSARVYKENGMTKEAVGCFFAAKDFESILSCELVCLITESFDGISYTKLAKEVLKGSSDYTLADYPYSMLRLCYALYAGCEFEEFGLQMDRARIIISGLKDDELMGEWHLVNAFTYFPDIDKMAEEYREAAVLMIEPSRIFIKEEPFMFGCASMWYLFYSQPGKMMETADKLSEAMSIYNDLTNGHGEGAAEIYKGEALSVQGRFEESDIYAYQAAFLSEQAGNTTATYGAALLLGINAIYRSDMIGLQKAIDYLENKALGYSFLQGKTLGTYMVETVRGYLLGLMMETGRSALWTQGEADSLSDLTFTNFMIKTCRITDLLLKKEYKRAIASVEASLQLDPRLISTSTRNFMYCGLALGYMAIGRLLKAGEYLDKSLEIAGQDKNYTFLACFRKYFQVLFLNPKIASKHAETIKEIKALDIRYTRADASHIFAEAGEVPELSKELTKRERQVAELAAKGLRNAEIADALGITENTVKHNLKIIFQKMNIDRRSKLIDMLR